ncbi:MAG: metal ABC transporter ATP-binding protein [Synergistaceae bacterium]|jgi:zinc transport system ATP-binding protein|nr:metal ABC transporter ATP-binding protein [Synergistaceae bacterium]
MSLVSCVGAALGYNGVPVLRGVDFSVGAGDYVCVTGENGSGKSTLILGMLRLLRPIEGRIEYGDGLAPDGVGYLPQRSAGGASFPAGAFEVVLSGRLASRGLRPFYSRRDRAVAADSMRRLGVYELRDKNFGELSGGQRQRVLLARALCSEGRLLILDEPVAGLDPMATVEFYEALSEIRSAGDVTVIMVSHDVRRAVSDASHVLYVHGGGVLFADRENYLASDAGKKFIGGLEND